MKLNEKLIQIRKKNGLSQEEFGEKLIYQGKLYQNGSQNKLNLI